jgi:hypothetical protein
MPMGMVPPPAPRKSNTALIVAVVGVLVLLLVGGGVTIGILAQGDDSSSASGESTDAPGKEKAKDPKAEAAEDLSAGLAAYGTSAESYCQLFYAIGPEKLFSSMSECVESQQTSYPLPSGDQEKYGAARFPESALVEVGENAYAFGDGDFKFPKGAPSGEHENVVSVVAFVAKYVDSAGGWRVVGVGGSEWDVGYFPEEARDLVLGVG